jgi:L-cystine uptake protein TcyP (sodium:dicarboxylate symporter family)
VNSVFFQQFLVISDVKTVLFLAILVGLCVVLRFLTVKKMTFAKRVLLGTGLGLVLGIVMQAVAGFPQNPGGVVFIRETTGWFGLIGGGFIDLVRMLVVPLVMVSIIKVIIDMEVGLQINKMVRNALGITMTMAAISVIVGLTFGILFQVGGAGQGVTESAAQNAQAKAITPLYTTLRNLLPGNPVQAMVDLNIIGIVIFSAFWGFGAKRMSKKYMSTVKPFFDLVHGIHKIITSIAISIVKLMPYAVIPLLANTVAGRGIGAIAEVGKFIGVLYAALAAMFVIQLAALALFKVNPFLYVKKSLPVLLLAFTSRSSVGCLPVTIDMLINKLGVNRGTANFVASFGSTAGMQGCAGVFPALLIVFVCNTAGIPLDITLLVMAVIVISIGSLGIAGIPGTATMAASVALSGVGISSLFSLISPVIAIDPLIDMGRTVLNVSGSMINALLTDKTLGQLDYRTYTDMSVSSVVSMEE